MHQKNKRYVLKYKPIHELHTKNTNKEETKSFKCTKNEHILSVYDGMLYVASNYS